ncbi:DUF4402 domain-containing protein [Sphingomonas astaxanthinifaciens]|uniref:DUF4402 domain-containing protein n=1 Tax=Sphingomonas astaxanthinifaciens DSM 22298 TaxID=1123267 RepID=A0ABQ5Z217_9SPHN|nr:DUF4402 domain-containing protein [Sphingomonas astaxanthinifaciens]GLR46798.1 hypothetical protein GCM10007925_05090 [Sphingomonas astaxanthinifaciens DSM 22298]
MKKILVATAAMAAIAVATPAAAQSATGANPKANANARLIKPLTLTAVRDLNFGTIVLGTLTANETVSINGAGVVTCGGGVNLTCTGSPTSANYKVTGTQGQTVLISSAAASFPLSGSNGGTLNLVPSFPASLVLGNSGAPGNSFDVGGSVVITSTTPDGVYSGQIDIQVAYQ